MKLHNGQYKILDPTWVPFVREEWSSLEQQQNYLMGVPEGADLMITPISAPENHPLKITGNTTILEDGSLEGQLLSFLPKVSRMLLFEECLPEI